MSGLLLSGSPPSVGPDKLYRIIDALEEALPAHVGSKRAAYVYIRQSSLQQVRQNLESGRRQYEKARV
jgi:hypothetical protein